MKTLFAVFFAISLSLTTCSQKSSNTTASNEAETTTYYFIRHAEKDRTDATNKNPNLNESGLKRADKWANYFKDIKLDAIYSTHYNRTQQTAQPTANAKKLDILDYDPRALYTTDFAKATKGKTVLVVGHSNTTPAFVNMVLGHDKYKDIDDNDNSQLFMVTISEEKTLDEVISIN
ncbi:SixA phosphatase family protein [Psychroserpens damuponensis]|uniref:SixA phosphatase family protein n=1 Tax=Psychroserpens damuponensis TaxID=943936 RepID=UPI00058B3D47|nr:phosphoglycerate mutase family protein [Psychroserpens damuponensis]